MNQTAPAAIPASCRGKFETDGYFVLPRIVEAQQIELMREKCDDSVTGFAVEDDCEGNVVESPDRKSTRLYAQNRYMIRDSGTEGPVAKLLFSELFEAICRATLGATAYLFRAQFVIVGPGKKETFGWRQPSWIVKTKHRPYITCVVALDDMTEANGALRLLPFSPYSTRELLSEEKAYDGPEEGKQITMSSGGIAVFSSYVFYRICSNRTDSWRRAFYAQFSPELLRNPDGTLMYLNTPFLVNGKLQLGTS